LKPEILVRKILETTQKNLKSKELPETRAKSTLSKGIIPKLHTQQYYKTYGMNGNNLPWQPK